MEALTTLLIFILFSGALFIIFQIGSRGFELSVARQGVQNDARRLGLYVDKELRSSNLISFVVQDGPNRRVNLDGKSVHRDALCFVSVKDWRATTFDPVSIEPNWDCYIIYYATKEEPHGRLIRAVVEPNKVSAAPWNRFLRNPDRYIEDDPSRNGSRQLSYRVLASNVAEFRCSASAGLGHVNLRLRLRENTSKFSASGAREGSTFELKYEVTPNNTK